MDKLLDIVKFLGLITLIFLLLTIIYAIISAFIENIKVKRSKKELDEKIEILFEKEIPKLLEEIEEEEKKLKAKKTTKKTRKPKEKKEEDE